MVGGDTVLILASFALRLAATPALGLPAIEAPRPPAPSAPAQSKCHARRYPLAFTASAARAPCLPVPA